MASTRILFWISLFCLAVFHGQGQFAIDHAGNFEDRVDGYRIQYHDQHNLLLLFTDELSCFVADIVRGSSLSVRLEMNATRLETQREIIHLIEEGHTTPTTIGEMIDDYHDALLRAFCWVAEIYTVDVSSLQRK